MSGHSKFANIKHKKEKNDATKGRIFTIIGREIAVAVKEGGADPANNSKLRDIIVKAKSNNMPNDTIERGIKKAAGDMTGVNYEHVTYEGYGAGGVAIIVDALTDNKNRTAANVRNAFTKGNGSVGAQGCVSFMFDKKGQIVIEKEAFEDLKSLSGKRGQTPPPAAELDEDGLMMTALEAGADDFIDEGDCYEILTDPDAFSAVYKAMEDIGVPMALSEISKLPQNIVEVTDDIAVKNIQKTLALLDEDDDVENVYTNWEGGA